MSFMPSPFKDHFSRQAAAYQTYRPTYPVSLFEYIASLLHRRDAAWDCATGNGQAALGLTPFFDKIIATDASEKQLSLAVQHPKIQYQLASAEKTSLLPHSIDLVQVAQALHWFDWALFYREVRRVLRQGGMVAVWCYGNLTIAPAVDAIVEHFYRDIVGAYWPAERVHIESGYKTIPFPFEQITAPAFVMCANWTLPQLTGYLSTWSATQRYCEAHGADPLTIIHRDLQAAWGDPDLGREIGWPLHVRLGWR